MDNIAHDEVVLAEPDHINRTATSEYQTQSLQETEVIPSGPEQNTHQNENR